MDQKEAVYSGQQACDKNIEEYNETADSYDSWCQDNVLMQKYCYYSTFAELEKEGVESKTFLEVGCGPCPIGRRLATQGVKKIYGLDISSEMIECAKRDMTAKGLIDKFEFVCHDILDETFQLSEKVDCVVLSYTLTTFINSYEQLAKIIKRCADQLKDDGYMFIADFAYVDIPNENFWCGQYTKLPLGRVPGDFEMFHFMIDSAPDSPFEIFNIHPHLMFKAGHDAGLHDISYLPQYPDPAYKDDKVVRRYLDECKPSDYLMKFKFMRPSS